MTERVGPGACGRGGRKHADARCRIGEIEIEMCFSIGFFTANDARCPRGAYPRGSSLHVNHVMFDPVDKICCRHAGQLGNLAVAVLLQSIHFIKLLLVVGGVDVETAIVFNRSGIGHEVRG